MISKKLSKQLKDIGYKDYFPKENPLTGKPLTEEQIINVISLTPLSDFIKACGEVQLSVAINGYSIAIQLGSEERYKGEGKNPEEAVGKLLLSINKK